MLRPGAAAAFIRDAEIENTIRAYATPIFQAAGLEPSSVEVYLINDRHINAFVAGGQKLFLNTGLLVAADNANQVIGVIAHEVGHIRGGHLARTHDALRNSTAAQIIGMVLGVAAAAAGRPDIGGLVAAGGRDMALRTYLKYSRTQEGAADSAAMQLLDATHQSSRGLLQFLKKLEGQELLTVGRQQPYLRSHPLTSDRIAALEAHVRRSPYSNAPEPPRLERMHRRMVAKLKGFLDDPGETLREYPDTDNRLEAHYARAIAYHKKHELAKALAEIDGLLAEYPDDPFFHELRGQILFESGRAGEALASYQRAVNLLPDAPLLRIGLAETQLAVKDPRLVDAAIDNLRAALLRERDNPTAWRHLGEAYYRAGQPGKSSWARAEETLLLGQLDDARYHAGKAVRTLAKGSPEWLQAEDILRQAKEQAKRKKRNRW